MMSQIRNRVASVRPRSANVNTDDRNATTDTSALPSKVTPPSARFAARFTSTRVVVAAMLITFLTSLGVVASTATPALASAYGCTGYGSGVTWQGFYVRNGTWCGGINGSGTYVNYFTGNFYTHLIGPNLMCNTSFKVDFYDRYGHWYGWRQGGTAWGCSYARDLPGIGYYGYLHSGSVRITFQSNGNSVAAVWESIY